MKKTFFLFCFIIIGSIIPANAQIYHDFPPTPAFRQIGSDNGTVYAKNYYYPVNFTGGSGISVKSSNSTHKLIISSTITQGGSGTYNTTQANNANINSGGAKINFINGTGNPIRVVNSQGKNQVNVTISNSGTSGITSVNSQNGPTITIQGGGSTTVTTTTNTVTVTGKTYQNNTGQNLGTHGTGIYSGISGSVLQFLSLIAKYPLSLASNSTNVILSFTAKINNQTCSGSNNFFNKFDNVTGNFICSQVSGFLTNAVLSINSDTSANQKITGHNSITVVDNSPNHDIECISCLNKTNNGGKATGSVGVLAASSNDQVIGRNFTGTTPIVITKTNDTDVTVSCPTCSTAVINEINVGKGTGSKGFSAGMSGNTVQIKNATAGTGISIASNNTDVTITNASPLSSLSFSNIGKGTGSKGFLSGISGTNLQGKNLTTTTPLTVSSNTTDVTVACPTCSIGAITTINSQSPTASNINLVRGLSNNTDILNQTGKITIYIKPNVVLTNGSNQTITKGVNFNEAAKITGLLLNTTSQGGSYTVGKTDDTILVNATHGNYTITIPSLTTVGTGKLYMIQKVDFSKNFVTIKPSSGKIDGFNNYNLTYAKDTLLIQNNNTNWITWFKPLPSLQPIRNSTSNEWISSWAMTGTPTTFQTVNNTLYAIPIRLDRPMKLSQIESEVTTAATLSNFAKCRMGIYTDSNGYPQNLISNSDVSDFSSLSNGVMAKTFSSNIVLEQANYYNVIDCASGTGGTATITQDTEAQATNAVSSTAATQTQSITIGTNTNEVCFTMIGFQNAQTNHNNIISTVKIGTTSFTKAVNKTITQGAANVYDSEIWYLVNPPTGAQTITVTPAVTTTYQMSWGTRCLFNVSSSPIGNTGTNSGTASPEKLVTTIATTGSIYQEGGFMLGCTTTSGTSNSGNGTSDWTPAIQSAGFYGGAQHNSSPNIGKPNTLTWTTSCGSGSIASFTDTGIEIKAGPNSGTLPIVRAIPNGNLFPILQTSSTMGSANLPTMWTVTNQLGLPTTTALPYSFPSGASLATSNVPWVQMNPVG